LGKTTNFGLRDIQYLVRGYHFWRFSLLKCPIGRCYCRIVPGSKVTSTYHTVKYPLFFSYKESRIIARAALDKKPSFTKGRVLLGVYVLCMRLVKVENS
jgi:hypothetical protein